MISLMQMLRAKKYDIVAQNKYTEYTFYHKWAWQYKYW